MHLLGSKTIVFIGGVITGQLFKSGLINKAANSALNGVEGLLKTDTVEKIRKADKTTRKSTPKS